MDTQRPSGDVGRQANTLADLKLSGSDLDSIMGEVGRLAVAAMPGWDAAAASVLQRSRVATFGATDERVNPVDQAQYDLGRGPCVDALGEGTIKYFDGENIEGRWRQFAEVAADHDVYSVLSFPLKIDDEVLGALNFYSKERDALRSGQREEGWVFASQAAVTVANAQAFISAQSQVDQLKDALETRTMIGQATGLLMTQEGLSSDEAFQKLVKVSQNTNLKLRDIAARYVQAWEEKAGGKTQKS